MFKMYSLFSFFPCWDVDSTSGNSFKKISFLGVPLIATPLFVDQNYNTYVALQQGTGVYINFKEISIQIINETLTEVLYSDK